MYIYVSSLVLKQQISIYNIYENSYLYAFFCLYACSFVDVLHANRSDECKKVNGCRSYATNTQLSFSIEVNVISTYIYMHIYKYLLTYIYIYIYA